MDVNRDSDVTFVSRASTNSSFHDNDPTGIVV